MNKERRYTLMFLVLLTGGIMGFAFQNCSKVNYQQTGSNVNQQGTIRTLTINPTFNSQNADMKVLFVVDDSYTMSQSQNRLSNAVDSLMNPLFGRNIEFRIVSTSGIPSNLIDYDISAKYFDDQHNEFPANQVASNTNYTIEKTVTNLATGRHNRLVSYRNYSQAQFNTVKSQVKSAILQAGVNGSDNEEGLCATARQLFDEGPQRFFKEGDKAAIILLTDEDDSSLFKNCVSKYSEKVSNKPVVYYNYLQKRAKLQLEYQVNMDGVVGWYAVSWGVGLPESKFFTAGSTCDQSDLNAAVQKITANGYIIRNVSSCVYEALPTTYFGKDLGDDGSNSMVNLCQSQVIYQGISYPDLYAFVTASGLSAVNGSCQRLSSPANTITRTDIFTSVIAGDTASTQIEDIKNAIITRSNSLFGSGFIIAPIIRKSGESCALQAGQSYGVKYQDLAFKLPKNSVTESLCASDFSNVLSQVSQFISNTAATSYVVSPMSDEEKINSVTLVRNGQKQVLTVSQYEAVGNVITITGISLQQGDTLEVVVGPK